MITTALASLRIISEFPAPAPTFVTRVSLLPDAEDPLREEEEKEEDEEEEEEEEDLDEDDDEGHGAADV